VFFRHRGHDPGGILAGHRPQDALTEDGIGGPHRPRGHLGPGGAQDLSGRFDVESVDQPSDSGCVQVVDGASGSRELDGVASVGCEMQVCPRHDILGGVGCQASQSEPAEHAAESHLDADQLEPTVRCLREQDIGDPGESPAHDVDDLGVQHISYQQDFIGTEAVDGRGDGEGGRVDAGTHQDTVLFEFVNRRPRHQEIGRLAPPDEESLHHSRGRIPVEINGEISQATDGPTVGRQHILAGFAGQQAHRIPMTFGREWFVPAMIWFS